MGTGRQSDSVRRATKQLQHCRVVLVLRLLEAIEDLFVRGACLSDLVLAGFDEAPESLTEVRVECFDVQHHVKILRGAECQPRLFHGERCRGSAYQHVLVGMCGEELPKQVQSPHHGKCFRSSSSAICTRSSAPCSRLSVSDSGSTTRASGVSAGLYVQSCHSLHPSAGCGNSLG